MRLISALAVAAVGGALSLCTGAQASNINISGTLGTIPLGTSSGDNNVINNTTTNLPAGYNGITGPADGSGWYYNGSVTTNLSAYTVTWFFLGSESGYTNTFTSSSPILTKSEGNQNSNCCYNVSYFSPTPFGVTTSTLSTIPLQLANGQNPPFVAQNGNDPYGAIIYAYVDPVYTNGNITGWALDTQKRTDWFAFGFNDDALSSSTVKFDHDFDDFMGVGHVQAVPGPIVGAGLPGLIFASGGLLAWWRRKRLKTEDEACIAAA